LLSYSVKPNEALSSCASSVANPVAAPVQVDTIGPSEAEIVMMDQGMAAEAEFARRAFHEPRTPGFRQRGCDTNGMEHRARFP